MKLPLASDPVVRMRKLSALFALLASAAALRFAWPRLEGSWRWWFPALWIVSPCLVLYGRMARSYSLQVLLAVIAIDRFLKFARDPGNRRQALLFALASTLLLYTHYVPGIALLAAANLTLIFRLRSLRPLILPNAVIVLLYSPWIGIALYVLRRVERTTDDYAVMGNPVSEHIVKLGYMGASFLFGKSLPWDAALAEHFNRHPHYFQPRARLDQLLIRLLGWKDIAPYLYEVVEFTPRD